MSEEQSTPQWSSVETLFEHDTKAYTISGTLEDLTEEELVNLADQEIKSCYARDMMLQMGDGDTAKIFFYYNKQWIEPEEFYTKPQALMFKKMSKRKGVNEQSFEDGSTKLGFCLSTLRPEHELFEVNRMVVPNKLCFNFRITSKKIHKNLTKYSLQFEQTYFF